MSVYIDIHLTIKDDDDDDDDNDDEKLMLGYFYSKYQLIYSRTCFIFMLHILNNKSD